MERSENAPRPTKTNTPEEEVPLDAISSASTWSKVSKKSRKHRTHLYWLLGGVVAVIVVLMLSYHHNTVVRKQTINRIENTDYQASLSVNMRHLRGLDQSRSAPSSAATPNDENFQKSLGKNRYSKEYLARQNAPTRMYSNPFSQTRANTLQNKPQVTLVGHGANAQFANANTMTTILEAKRLAHPSFTIASGAMIQAVLETAIDSDLPGMVRAVVSRPVYSYTNERLIIPAGSRLIGQYTAGIMQGQNRVMIIWNRVLLPGGVAVQLNSPGTDRLGRAGQGADSVNTHFFARFSQAALLSLIGTGSASIGVGASDQSNSAATYRTAIAQSFQQSAQQSLQGTLPMKPTLHIHQGVKVHVFVAHDVSFYHVLKGRVALPAPLPSFIK